MRSITVQCSGWPAWKSNMDEVAPHCTTQSVLRCVLTRAPIHQSRVYTCCLMWLFYVTVSFSKVVLSQGAIK